MAFSLSVTDHSFCSIITTATSWIVINFWPFTQSSENLLRKNHCQCICLLTLYVPVCTSFEFTFIGIGIRLKCLKVSIWLCPLGVTPCSQSTHLILLTLFQKILATSLLAVTFMLIIYQADNTVITKDIQDAHHYWK